MVHLCASSCAAAAALPKPPVSWITEQLYANSVWQIVFTYAIPDDVDFLPWRIMRYLC